jgi:hypothetical protein
MALKTFSPLSNTILDATVLGQDGICFFSLFFMKVMIFMVIMVCPVTLEAQVVSLLMKFETVDIMAITALYIPLIHLALSKRAINIDFIKDLSIREVKALIQ